MMDDDYIGAAAFPTHHPAVPLASAGSQWLVDQAS